jgi:hypothetical protein
MYLESALLRNSVWASPEKTLSLKSKKIEKVKKVKKEVKK